MGQVRVNVNGRSYVLGCDDGEEGRVDRLAKLLDKRVGDLVAGVGQVGEGRLLLMAALLLADEMLTARQDAQALRLANEELRRDTPGDNEESANLNHLVSRLEGIAARLETN